MALSLGMNLHGFLGFFFRYLTISWKFLMAYGFMHIVVLELPIEDYLSFIKFQMTSIVKSSF